MLLIRAATALIALLVLPVLASPAQHGSGASNPLPPRGGGSGSAQQSPSGDVTLTVGTVGSTGAVTWLDGQTSFTGLQAAFKVHADVGGMIYLLCDAYLIEPPTSETERRDDYDELVGLFPKLAKEPGTDPSTQFSIPPSPLFTASLGILGAALGVSYGPSPVTGSVSNETCLYFLQPNMGFKDPVTGYIEPEDEEIWCVDSPWWETPGGEYMHDYWKPVAVSGVDDGIPNNAYELSLEAMWQMSLEQKAPVAAPVFFQLWKEPGYTWYEQALSVGLGLSIQAVVVSSPITIIEDFTGDELNLPGLLGIDQGLGMLNRLSDTLTISILSIQSSTSIPAPVWYHQGTIAANAGETIRLSVGFCPHRTSYLNVLPVGDQQAVSLPIGYGGPGIGEVRIPSDMLGATDIISISNAETTVPLPSGPDTRMHVMQNPMLPLNP